MLLQRVKRCVLASPLRAVLVGAIALIILAPRADAGTTGRVSAGPASWPFTSLIAVNYSGFHDSNPLPPDQAMQQVKANFGAVRFYGDDPNTPALLQAARTQGLQVALGTTLAQIANFQTPANADAFVSQSVVPNKDIIKLVIIGNEPDVNGSLVTALTNVGQSLNNAGLNSIPVAVNLAYTNIENTYPPACGDFVPASRGNMTALFNYLGSTGSFLLLDIYPYISEQQNIAQIPLAYALGTSSSSIGPACGGPAVTEPSLFQAQLDAYTAAMGKLNLTQSPPVYIGETGWASGGNAAQNNGVTIASIANEQTFVTTYVPYARAQSLPGFLFEMYDENQKCTPDCDENHYGLFTDTGTAKFPLPSIP